MDTSEDVTIVNDSGSDQQSPSNVSSAAYSKSKPRVALACLRCKRRKQRCDGGRPVCTSCIKAKTDCIYEKTLRPRYPGGKSLYISALEERIAFLEERLPEFSEDHFTSNRKRSSVSVPDRQEIHATALNKIPGREESVEEREKDEEEKSENEALVDGVAYLSLCATGTADIGEPFYLGSSSGATIARIIQASIFRASRSPRAAAQGSNQRKDAITSLFRPTTTSTEQTRVQYSSTSRLMPREPEAKMLFATFFDRLHPRWPILSRQELSSVYERQWDDGALSIMERSVLHMIYAISARFMQLMQKKCDADPESHFAAAVEPMDYILEQHNVATVQFLALLVVHGQRSPYGAGLWSQARYAIALCIELGLHRKQTMNSIRRGQMDAGQQDDRIRDKESQEIRKRVFWACYCLDRITTITTGRTFGISDRDINADLPSESPEFWHLTATSQEGWHNIRPFVHMIGLRRLQSKVFQTVWRVDKDLLGSPTQPEKEKLNRKMTLIKTQLDEWMARIPVSSSGNVRETSMSYDLDSGWHESIDYSTLQYHKTVLSLYTALLPMVKSTDPRFLSATRSAAEICATYKRLHTQNTLSYTVVALHSCFIAGLSLIYCLWRDSGLFDYNFLEATRACSFCLTIFGEKWPGAAKYRDIFDTMSGSLLKRIFGGPTAQATHDDTGRQKKDFTAAKSNEREMHDTTTDTSSSVLQPDSSMPLFSPFQEKPDPLSYSMHDETMTDSERSGVLLDVVKDAFMEVDEQASSGGGWQGWRMFTEMVQTDIAMAPQSFETEVNASTTMGGQNQYYYDGYYDGQNTSFDRT